MEKKQVSHVSEERVIFTEKMREEYTILFPNMLPRHFKLITKVFQQFGYNAVQLQNGVKSGTREIIDTGLRCVHNDACYPALLMIGQCINALESGKYDTHKVALLMTQTGGGCRASNYISLMRKALKKTGFEYVPVISLNISGLEKNPGFKLTPKMINPTVYSMLFGDLLMCLVNQLRAKEKVVGSAEELADIWSDRLAERMTGRVMPYSEVKRLYREIIADFAAIETKDVKPIKVGIVGEIFVKFSPLGNNCLEDFLVSEGAEPVMAGLTDFILYCIYNPVIDAKLYGSGRLTAPIYQVICDYVAKKQQDMIDAIKEEGTFDPPAPFYKTCASNEGYIGSGVKMGEGWLLTAEMLELIDSGVTNIVCAQPFGCLPNHISGKGMMKPIKDRNPGVNIVAIDYDSGATKINQENRIKLMLANASRESEV